MYHWAFGAGQNAVSIVGVASGGMVTVPNSAASSVTVASNGRHLAFSGDGYVWAADVDGSNLTTPAQGYSPAWQPLAVH